MRAYAITNHPVDGYSSRHGLEDSDCSETCSVYNLLVVLVREGHRTASAPIPTVSDGENVNRKYDAFGITERHQTDAATQ